MELACVICVPTLIAATTASFSSLNGLVAATLGIFPASVSCLLGVALIATSIDLHPGSNGVRLASLMCVLGPLLAFQSSSLLERSYRDTPFSYKAKPAFALGPFAGLLTANWKAGALSVLSADLESMGGSVKTLFISDSLNPGYGIPAGYLLSNLKPRTFSTWPN